MTATHTKYATQFWNTFDHRHPVLLRLQPGESVSTRTVDASGWDEHDVPRAAPSNPLTGPFHIEGAEPGDAIAVYLNRLRLNRATGYSAYRLGLYALTADAIAGLYPNEYKADVIRPGRANIVPWDIDIAKGLVSLREPRSAAMKLEFPADPMLGVIGVAPAGDFAPTSMPSGPYGGNMDFNEIREGTTVVLPVFHPGALLFVGDGHALMADGEPIGTGIETSMDVELTVTLRQNAQLTNPRVETASHIISVGSQAEFTSDIDRALQLATADMVRWLAEDYGLEAWAAHLLVGMVGRYHVVTVQGSMALAIPRRFLHHHGI